MFTTGALVNTQNPFDVAVEGDGFFQVTLPSGELRLRRDGALRLNAQGNLGTSDGFAIAADQHSAAGGVDDDRFRRHRVDPERRAR